MARIGVQDVQKVQGVQLRPIRLIRLIRGRETKRGKTLYTQVAPVGRRTCGMLIPRVTLRSALGYVLATLSGCLLGSTPEAGKVYSCLSPWRGWWPSLNEGADMLLIWLLRARSYKTKAEA